VSRREWLSIEGSQSNMCLCRSTCAETSGRKDPTPTLHHSHGIAPRRTPTKSPTLCTTTTNIRTVVAPDTATGSNRRSPFPVNIVLR
jgi:hypothetical protein